MKSGTSHYSNNKSFTATPKNISTKLHDDFSLIRPESRTVAQDLQKLRKKKQEKRQTGYNVTGTDEESTGPVDELFKFIGCDPNKAVVRISFKFIELLIYVVSINGR